MREPAAVSSTGLVDLLAVERGADVVGCSDEYFAEAHKLLQPDRAVFIPGKFTDRGKWMDGWESRRKRIPGYDWCILKLRAAGHVLVARHRHSPLNGNHPQFASVEGLMAPVNAPLESLAAMHWDEVLGQARIRPDSQTCSPRPTSARSRTYDSTSIRTAASRGFARSGGSCPTGSRRTSTRKRSHVAPASSIWSR